jgi:hypothetical protein
MRFGLSGNTVLANSFAAPACVSKMVGKTAERRQYVLRGHLIADQDM